MSLSTPKKLRDYITDWVEQALAIQRQRWIAKLPIEYQTLLNQYKIIDIISRMPPLTRSLDARNPSIPSHAVKLLAAQIDGFEGSVWVDPISQKIYHQHTLKTIGCIESDRIIIYKESEDT